MLAHQNITYFTFTINQLCTQLTSINWFCCKSITQLNSAEVKVSYVLLNSSSSLPTAILITHLSLAPPLLHTYIYKVCMHVCNWISLKDSRDYFRKFSHSFFDSVRKSRYWFIYISRCACLYVCVNPFVSQT